MDSRLSRRQTLAVLFLLGTGCPPSRDDAPAPVSLLPREDGADPPAKEDGDSVDALFDAILPSEPSSPGAREAGADRVLARKGFARIAIAQGLLPPLPDALVGAIEDGRDALRAALNVELDARAQSRRPGARFADLPRDAREAIARDLEDDAAHAPVFQALRAACFFAWLGGFTSDAGLRAVGFPPYEDLADGRACSGYPRTKSTGRVVDAARDDLAALARAGDLDDYTYAIAPLATAGVDLAQHLDPHGDLP